MSFLISSQRSFERDALSEAYYLISDVLGHNTKLLKSRVPGLSLLRLTDDSSDPLIIMKSIEEYIEDKGPLIACLKIVPLQLLIKTNLSEIIIQASKKAKSIILPSNSWRLTVNKRQTKLGTFEVIEAVADKINWGKVNLTDPDFEIRIEIIRDLTGISVFEPNTELSMSKYNQ